MQLLGQHQLKSQLLQAVAYGRVPHAMLFLGAAGGSGLAMANWFSRVLLCENAEIQPCDVCPACKKTAKNIHPDVHFSFPTIGGKAVSTTFLTQWRAALAENPYLSVQNWLDRIRDKESANSQGNITTDECAAILKKLSLKIFEGKYKILIQWRPEFLGEQGNKLLKMIEEPPENTIFLLVAENADLILPTILSRTQLIKTEPISDAEIRDGLISTKHLNAPRAEQIAFLANGNFGTALEMAEAEDTDDAQFLLDWLRECYRLQATESQKLVKRMDVFAQKGRENQKIFLNYALHFMREFMVMRETGQTRVRLRPNELATAQNLAKVIDFQRVTKIVQLFDDLFFHVERNANPKILFMDASLKINQILKAN
jgi:DNA polymerase III subunit delta'